MSSVLRRTPLGNGAYTYFGYDELSRLTTQTDALDQSTYYTYDAAGNLLATKDPLAHTTTSTYDDLNRTTSTTDPLAAKTYFDYDLNGNLTEVIDAESRATYYTYDEANRLTSMKNALLQSETYTYDQNGNLAVSQDPDSRATYFTYDELDRQTCVEYPDGVSHYFVYDEVSNLVRAQDARGWTYFTYDALDRLTNEKAPDGAETSHAWDAVGRRTRVTSPAGSTYYAYDAVGRMEHAQAENAAVGTAYYTYDAAGNVANKVLGNGCFTYFTYDEVNRTTAILNCLPDGSALAYFEYTYDPAGRITKCVREDASVVYYGYDAADRLTGETWQDSGGGTIYAFEWDYDKVGNRTYQKRGSDETYYEYDAGNELTRCHVVPDDTWTYFAYDPHGHGNCVRIQEPAGTTYFAYSDADLVTMIKYPDATVNYFWYDALMRRYAIQDSGGLAYFTYDTDGLCPLVERDSAGSVTASYTRGYAPIPGIRDLDASELTVGEATYFQYNVYDRRGSVVAIMDENGNVTGRFEYDAWGGKLRDNPPPEGTRFGQSAPAWFEVADSNGDLGLSGARVYHKATGRFLQREASGGLSGDYDYCSSDPVNRADPSGRDDEKLKKLKARRAELLRQREGAKRTRHAILDRALEQTEFWGRQLRELRREGKRVGRFVAAYDRGLEAMKAMQKGDRQIKILILWILQDTRGNRYVGGEQTMSCCPGDLGRFRDRAKDYKEMLDRATAAAEELFRQEWDAYFNASALAATAVALIEQELNPVARQIRDIKRRKQRQAKEKLRKAYVAYKDNVDKAAASAYRGSGGHRDGTGKWTGGNIDLDALATAAAGGMGIEEVPTEDHWLRWALAEVILKFECRDPLPPSHVPTREEAMWRAIKLMNWSADQILKGVGSAPGVPTRLLVPPAWGAGTVPLTDGFFPPAVVERLAKISEAEESKRAGRPERGGGQ